MSTVNQSVSQLPLFQEDFPASRSVLPGSAEAKKITVISGQRCLGLYKSSSPLGRFVRMLLVSSTWGSTMRFLTWKVRAMKHSRFLFQLRAQVPRTSDTECLLLPTPTAQEYGNNQSPTPGAAVRPSLSSIAKMWPTPNVCGNNNRKGASKNSGDGLATAVKMWPTPKGSMRGDCPSERQRRSPDLQSAVKMFPSPKSRDYRTGDKPEHRRAREKLSGNWHSPDLNDVAAPGGQLNPMWVEWLMGFPAGWTDLDV